jgi:hypothetical protein
MRLSVEYLNDCKKRDLSCVEVAKEAGCGITAVYRFCKRNGIKLRKKPCGGASLFNNPVSPSNLNISIGFII